MNDNQPSYVGAIAGAFRYPIRGDGAFVIGTGVVAFSIADFISFYAGIVGLILQLMIAGYVAAYAKDVVQTSAMGEDEAPKWLDFSNWMEDLLEPVLQFIVVAALAFGPFVFLQYKPLFHGAGQFWGSASALLWGCLTFPVMILAVAMTDSMMAAFNPLPLMRAVGLAWRTYFPTCLFCGLVCGVEFGAGWLLSLVGKIPVLPHLLHWLVALYLLTAAMRSIGLFYRHNHEALGWY